MAGVRPAFLRGFGDDEIIEHNLCNLALVLAVANLRVVSAAQLLDQLCRIAGSDSSCNRLYISTIASTDVAEICLNGNAHQISALR